MDESELKKLSALLKHWIEHSHEHAEEYNQWAQKAGADGYYDVVECLVSAAHGMGDVRHALAIALEKLEINELNRKKTEGA